MSLESLKRRVARLERMPEYRPVPQYGEMFISAKYLDQLSDVDRNFVLTLSNRGVTDEGASMQVTELSNSDIEALRIVAKRLDEIKAKERVN